MTEASLAHPSKKLAVSLVAMIATLALFAAVSAFAHGAPYSELPIIDPAIDQEAALIGVAAPVVVMERSAVLAR